MSSIPCPAYSSFHQSGFHSVSFRNKEIFPRLESQSNDQPPTWRTRVPFLVWPLPFDLSAKGDPTISYATDGIAVLVIGVLKLPYHGKVEAPTGESWNGHWSLNFMILEFKGLTKPTIKRCSLWCWITFLSFLSLFTGWIRPSCLHTMGWRLENNKEPSVSALINIHKAQWSLYVPPVQHPQILHSFHVVYLCVLYGSEIEQRLFPSTTLTDWFL
jgi:hypothetical protein